jgi:hypothetical protein
MVWNLPANTLPRLLADVERMCAGAGTWGMVSEYESLARELLSVSRLPAYRCVLRAPETKPAAALQAGGKLEDCQREAPCARAECGC